MILYYKIVTHYTIFGSNIRTNCYEDTCLRNNVLARCVQSGYRDKLTNIKLQKKIGQQIDRQTCRKGNKIFVYTSYKNLKRIRNSCFNIWYLCVVETKTCWLRWLKILYSFYIFVIHKYINLQYYSNCLRATWWWFA